MRETFTVIHYRIREKCDLLTKNPELIFDPIENFVSDTVRNNVNSVFIPVIHGNFNFQTHSIKAMTTKQLRDAYDMADTL